MRWLFILFIILIIVFIILHNTLHYAEKKILYYPTKKCVWKPKIPYEKVYLNVKDVHDVCHTKGDRKMNKQQYDRWNENNIKATALMAYEMGTLQTQIGITKNKNEDDDGCSYENDAGTRCVIGILLTEHEIDVLKDHQLIHRCYYLHYYLLLLFHLFH